MKALLETLVAGKSALEARNIAREYLQARILGCLQRNGAMSTLAFHGGTALRFLYGLPRYSEDLDFALERHVEHYDFTRYLRDVQAEFVHEGYRVSIKTSDKKVVQAAFVSFAGLMHEFGQSPHRDETLAIKLEVDTRPPSGAILDSTVIRRFVALRLQHHDRASLLAGKLHALLQRPFPKGRDIYDLFWYLSDPNWPAPNLNMLNAALVQSKWAGTVMDADNWPVPRSSEQKRTMNYI